MLKHAELWEQYSKTGDPTDLIEVYMNLARSIASKIHKSLPSSVMYEDVECSALQGLWQAIKRFDVTLSVPFGAYARRIIAGQVYDHIREADNESRSLRSLQKRIDEAEARLSHELTRIPNASEIADDLGITEEMVLECKLRINNAHTRSIESGPDDDNYNSQRNAIASNIKFHTPIDTYKTFSLAISIWTKKERLLFALMYFEGMSLDKAAIILNVPHPQVCQTHYRMGEQLLRIIND